MKSFLLLSALLLVTFSNIHSQSNAPKIINTWPEFGDCDVDTNVSVISFEFDQDMSTGYSFMNNPDMVPIVGIPAWKTKRILEVPVKLEPGRHYQASLNSQDYKGFRSEAGIPMDPDYLLFGAKNNEDSVTVDTALNRLNFEKFCDYFLKHYSYKDLSGINWENEFNTLKDDIILSKSDWEFGFKLLKVLKKANDIHLSINISNRLYSSGSFRLVPVNYNYNEVFSLLPDMQISPNNAVFTGNIANAGYILISSLDNAFTQDISFGIEKITQMKDLPFLIFDLRLNRGGNEQLAATFVSMILSDTITYEKVALYNETTGQFDQTVTKNVVPENTSIRYKGKIYVLIGGNVVSSAESFVLMLKQMPEVEVIGSKTYGSSGNPQSFQINDSITVNIPSWLAYDMDDRLIEGNGIDPDLKLEFPEEDYTTDDPVFNYVLDTLIQIPFITVSDLSIRLVNSISSASFEINSNIRWKMTCDQPWLTIESGIDSGKASITITAKENFSSLSRKATITLSGNGVPDNTIYVTQNGAAPVLSVSKNNLLIEGSANSTDTFNIISNTSWKAKSNQPWLTVNVTSGSDSAMIVATATENTTGGERLASIAVSANGVSTQYVVIHQLAPVINAENEISPGKIMIYPNPVKGVLNISGIDPLACNNRIEISDNAGKILLTLIQKNVSTVQINMTEYPSGFYIIRIHSGNEISQFKVIK